MAGMDLAPGEADLIAEMSSFWCRGFHEGKAPHDPLGCQMALVSAEFEAQLSD